MLATILKDIVGGFEFSFFSKKFERIGTKGHGNVFASAKGKKSRIDSYSHQEQCIDHIPYYLSGLSLHFFPTTFLEIAVFNEDEIK